MLKNKKYYIFALLLSFFIAKNSLATTQNTMLLGNYARQLLDLQQWDVVYVKERTKDINYLLGNINDQSLKNLNNSQKEQVIAMMRNMAINQLIKDKDYFKGYIINQYSKSFTQDELNNLIDYFKTDLMQMMIKAKVKNAEVKIDDINLKLTSQTEPDKKITTWFNSSYLNARYSRFQEDINPKLNKMIYERTKQVLKAIFDQIPNLAQSVTK